MDNPNRNNWEPVFQYNGPEHEANRQIEICDYAISKHLHTYSIEKEKFNKSNDIATFIEFLQSECINLNKAKDNLLNHFLSYDEFPNTMESGKSKFRQLTLIVEKLRAELKDLGSDENKELITFLQMADIKRNKKLTPNLPLPNSSEIKKEFLDFQNFESSKLTYSQAALLVAIKILAKETKPWEHGKKMMWFRNRCEEYSLKSTKDFQQKFNVIKIGDPITGIRKTDIEVVCKYLSEKEPNSKSYQTAQEIDNRLF